MMQGMKNIKEYGIFAVLDQDDTSKNKFHHYLVCLIPKQIDKTQIVFRFGRDGEYIGVSKGAQPELEKKMVDIAIQVDQGKVRKRTWSHSYDCACSIDKKLIRALLDEMATGKQVLIKVGKKEGILPLDDFAPALADYKARIAQTKKSWLWAT